MKKSRLFTLLTASLVLSMNILTGCGSDNYKNTEKVTPENYASVTIKGIDDDVMPVAGFLGPNDSYTHNGYKYPSTQTKAVYDKISAAGVNLIIDMRQDLANLADGNDVDTALTLAAESNIQYILKDSTIIDVHSTDPSAAFVADSSVMANRIQQLYSQYESLSGIYVRDEPAKVLFEPIEKALENFNTANETAGTDYTVYTNLFPPTIGTLLSGDGTSITYDTYLDEFCKTNPPYLMYDMYPFYGEEGSIDATWFIQLARIREKANDENIPFWLWLQVGGRWPDAQHLRIPTEADLLWSINTALSMGAKGLGYFALCMPPEHLAGIESPYYAGLINQFGSTNPAYYHAKKAAKQIQAVDEILMKSQNLGLINHGESPCTMSGEYLLTEFRQLKSIESSGACVVGCFDYNGGTALYVVNNSVSDKNSFTLNFDGRYGYDVIQRGEKFFASGKNLTVTLEAGEGALVTLR